MLIEFKFNNIYSYKNEANLTLLAPQSKVKTRYSDNYISKLGYDVLKSSIIVGENAGGKSNFIKALLYFKNLFNINNRKIKANKDLTFLNNNHEQSFNITILSNDIIYNYKLVISEEEIVYESLSYKENKNQKYYIIYKYEASIEKNYYTFELNADKNIKDVIYAYITRGLNNGLIISSLSILGVKHTSEFINQINNIYIFNSESNYNDFIKDNIDVMNKDEFNEIFRLIDSSIKCITIDKDYLSNSTITRIDNDNNIFNMSLVNESTGIKKFLLFALTIYKVIYDKAIVFNDELDQTFNSLLTSKVISFINSFEDTGQFIFTTHNIFNMNLQLLLKEQMNIVEKNKESLESSIYSIANFKDIRYDSNDKIYEFYMKGLLGGIDNAL